MDIDGRKYIRHPVEIPIEVAINSNCEVCTLQNLSQGGLCIVYPERFQKGEKVDVTISLCEPAFSAKAIVCWCKEAEKEFAVGVSFLTPQDAYTARMVEQICHIENYRQENEQLSGQSMSSEQAAKEWIAKYASSFPQI